MIIFIVWQFLLELKEQYLYLNVIYVYRLYMCVLSIVLMKDVCVVIKIVFCVYYSIVFNKILLYYIFKGEKIFV